MGSFWDRRARENPYYFIDNRLPYRDTDVERFWRNGESDLALILDALDVELSADDTVLELGCGMGRMTRAIASRTEEVIAVDVSKEMLALAREHNPQLANVRWRLGDGISLAGIPDWSVDVCLSFIVLQHIPDPSVTLGYIREMGRILRIGGWAGFQVSNDPKVHKPSTHQSWPRRALGALKAVTGRGPGGRTRGPWVGSAVELDEVARAATDANSAIERVEGEGQQLCLVLMRKREPVATA